VSEAGSGAPDLSVVLNEAHVLLERRRYTHARSVIAQGLRHFPQNTELLYLSAFVDYAEDNNDAAMQTVRQALAQDPEHVGARRLCAHLHEEAKEFAQAEALWIGLLREFPEDADSYAAYAELMLRTLNIEKATRLAEEGLRHEPEHAGCLYVAAMVDVVSGGGLRGSRNENLQRLLSAHPEQVRTSVALVIALSDQGRHRDALRVAQELLRSHPQSEQYVSLVRELKLHTHWSLLPLYPMQRWGWGGAIAVTVVGIIGVRMVNNFMPGPLGSAVVFAWLAYLIYSWVWPPLLRKLI
jgi:tetratricopeptide (TPR) repeat protein